MYPDFRCICRMVSDEERVEPDRVGEAPSSHQPRRGVGVVRCGDRLKSPADTFAELAHPGMTAVFGHSVLHLTCDHVMPRRSWRLFGTERLSMLIARVCLVQSALGKELIRPCVAV